MAKSIVRSRATASAGATPLSCWIVWEKSPGRELPCSALAPTAWMVIAPPRAPLRTAETWGAPPPPAAAGPRRPAGGPRSDAYTFFKKLGDAIETGPTGNNLRDLRILLAK